MAIKLPHHRPELPRILQRRHTDEFAPPPYSDGEAAVVRRVQARGPDDARRVGLSLADYWEGRHGTAAGLLELNAEFGDRFYEIPDAAALDRAAADEAFGGDELVIDVQTHFIADREACAVWDDQISAMYRSVAPKWWKGVDEIDGLNMAEYLRCVFLESETALAVLTSGPGLNPDRMLFNREMAGTRELFDRLGSSGRLLNHAVIHADVPGEIEGMARELERFKPVGWKCYTMGTVDEASFSNPDHGWWLDDERTGVRFIENAIALGVPLICAHKGISNLVPTGSPSDVGPAASGFPGVKFLIYHSGYEFPVGDEPEEGPYTEETADFGVNRLIKSLLESKLPPGSNVYAELGTTWFCLIRRPIEAAHVLGKLLVAVGEDNVLWGTDSIWYGPTQVSIDAFRAFQIPAALREEFGYPELTPAIKEKILGLNAARVYGLDPAAVRATAESDDLAWIKAAVEEYRNKGIPDA
jgi:predicted TIM-barrel fold metal-dependent hydrolase